MTRREMLALTSACVAAGPRLVLGPAGMPVHAPEAPAAGSLDETDFLRPSDKTRPWCYWYWVSNYISRDGITRDLEAMARVGIGEAMIANIAGRDIPLGDVTLFSELWWSLLEHAIREAGRLGLYLGLFNGPGWSQSGGPWIPPERSMRYVVSSETHVSGPMRFEGKLPSPKEPFQDIGTLAFPRPKDDSETIAAHSPKIRCTPFLANAERLMDGNLASVYCFSTGLTAKQPLLVDITVEEPFTARSLELYPIADNVHLRCELQAADASGNFHSVRSFIMDRRGLDRPQFQLIVGPMIAAPAVITFRATTSRHFRLRITDLIGTSGLAEIKLSAAARLDWFVEKELGKMYPAPLPEWNSYLWPPSTEPESALLTIAPTQTIDLTNHMSLDGTLRWDVPSGEWLILRSGMTPTGVTNHPVTPEGLGLECDKLSREAIDLHFAGFVGELLRRMPPADRGALRHVVVDSFEVGSQNWTDGFAERFHAALGYDPRPWLPVLTGRIVGSADRSDRFLWDLRRLVADEIAAQYVGGLREMSNLHGLRSLVEPYGSWGFPAEFLQYGGKSDDVAGEFWVDDDDFASRESEEIRAAASSAHIYGKQVVVSEAFTSARSFCDSPATLKTLGDWAFTEGVNHLMLHVYVHQPWEDRRPGVNAWFGTEFNRHNTWFEQSRSWIDYLRRCHYLLQQGRSAADVAYLIGEDSPAMTGPRIPALPPGYDYDFINGEVLLERVRVQDGRLVIENGPKYTLLVLPPIETIRPELLRKIRDLVAEGLAILGSPPKRSPSLQGHPLCDHQVQELTSQLWGPVAPSHGTLAQRRFGKGWVFSGSDMAEVFQRLDTRPAISCPRHILWTLRRTETADIYFLSNQTDTAQLVDVSFRVADRAPEFWLPHDGRVERTAWFTREDGRTRVPIAFQPQGSLFVVFRQPVTTPAVERISLDDRLITAFVGPSPIQLQFLAAGSISAIIQRPGRYTLVKGDGRRIILNVAGIPPQLDLAGPWKVSFPAGKNGGPKSLTLPHLISWPDSSDEFIRHFSGTASYRTSVYLPGEVLTVGRRLTLDLGKVEVMAQVYINGTDLGVLWCRPFAIDVTHAVSPGLNVIEVLVTNTWWNRLAGDETLPASERTTVTVWQSQAPRSSLLPAGLLGPVRIQNAIVEEFSQ